MKREDAYILAAPVFATYLMQASAGEALRYTSQAFSEVDGRVAREMFVAGLTPNPGAKLAQDELAVVRQFGYAAAQEEAGTPKDVLVESFLRSVQALAVGKVQAAMERFEGLYSGVLAAMIMPLFLLFAYALGYMDLPPEAIIAAIAGLGAAAVFGMYLSMPRDFSPVAMYGVSLPAAVMAGLIAAAAAWANTLPLSAAMLAAGLILTAWVHATGRKFWYRIMYEVPAMLRDFASRIAQGMPPDLAFRETSTTYRTARYVAFNYDIPSTMFRVAKAMYRAVNWAGPHLPAINFLQTYLDEIAKAVKKASGAALVFVGMYIGASAVILYALATASGILFAVASEASIGFLFPKAPGEVQYVAAQVFGTMVAIFIFAAFLHKGAWLGLTAGGAAGVAMYYAAWHLYEMWLPAL